MENIFTAAQPLLVFGKFLGLFAMTFEGPVVNGILKVKWRDVMISSFLLMTFLCFSIINFTHLCFLLSPSKILAEAWSFSKRSEFLIYVFLLCYHNYKRKVILRFLSTIYSVDEDVSKNIQENKLELTFLFTVQRTKHHDESQNAQKSRQNLFVLHAGSCFNGDAAYADFFLCDWTL